MSRKERNAKLQAELTRIARKHNVSELTVVSTALGLSLVVSAAKIALWFTCPWFMASLAVASLYAAYKNG